MGGMARNAARRVALAPESLPTTEPVNPERATHKRGFVCDVGLFYPEKQPSEAPLGNVRPRARIVRACAL